MNADKEIKVRKFIRKIIPTHFFEYDQSNSGGHFLCNNHICHRLFIEADNENIANQKALNLGVYFNGVEDGTDCDCCGDRWGGPYERVDLSYGCFPRKQAEQIAEEYGCRLEKHEGKHHPGEWNVIFPDIESYAQYLADKIAWTSPEARIFYKNGSVIEIFGREKK